jgi:hypothetical protein
VYKALLQPEIKKMEKINRRLFLKYGAGAGAAFAFGAMLSKIPNAFADGCRGSSAACYIKNRGILILDADILSLNSWPQMAKNAGLTTLGIGPGGISGYLTNFLHTAAGQKFLNDCTELKINVEHELHSIQELLPRSLFSANPLMFRMNANGERTPDYNCCAHSAEGIEVICNNAVSYARQLISTTGRYYFWFDDGSDIMCHCPQCENYTDSEKALIVENQIINALRQNVNPNAQLAHLAYQSTWGAPAQVTPSAGVFLEFAPFGRRYDVSLSNTSAKNPYRPTHGQYLAYLDANLAVFGNANAKILEYWLDGSLHSNWQRPCVQIPWNKNVFMSDLQTYTSRGITNITSYGAWIDSYYLNKYDSSPLKEYGQGLTSI